MKAIIYDHYGPPEVLRLVELPTPAPRDNEVRVRVRATTVTVGDTRMRRFAVPRGQWLFARLYLGVWRPRRKVLGMELAGDIDAVGQDVTRFKVGDPVFASTFEVNFGGYAEYKCFPEDGLVAHKPDNLNYEEAAAAVGAGMTALRCLRQGNIRPGQRVLIYGASGAVGTNAVQLARNHFGAEVTGVCSGANGDLVRSLGAAQVIDYTREDFTRRGEKYDVVFDAVARFPPARAAQALTETGVYLNVHKHSDADAGRSTGQEELLALQALIEAGQVRPVIDRCYPLEEIVEAHRYVDKGHKRGNLVVQVGGAMR
ncbi:MAG: NAD(P)-dependent alcohol dehydrogenase [Candidatus Promineofilum sp.]|jgi:NADPH:quinone reductase-like Zn-dependent oxidoreductase|nr:NAD(P)-dependent alcohol dehydrogenase [Promineifilum sp.]